MRLLTFNREWFLNWFTYVHTHTLSADLTRTCTYSCSVCVYLVCSSNHYVRVVYNRITINTNCKSCLKVVLENVDPLLISIKYKKQNWYKNRICYKHIMLLTFHFLCESSESSQCTSFLFMLVLRGQYSFMLTCPLVSTHACTGQHKQEEADAVKRRFAGDTRSDHLALLGAFQVRMNTYSEYTVCVVLVATLHAVPATPTPLHTHTHTHTH